MFTGMIVGDVKADGGRGLPNWIEPERAQAVGNLKVSGWIPCIRICLYNRCTCLDVLREGNTDRKIQENRSQRCWATSAFSVKNRSTVQNTPRANANKQTK